jgi:hypothetical protein
MPMLGILFDIDELGGGLYGYAAYKILFDAVDTRRLAGCSLSDGDTRETLSGRANHYCIAIASPNPTMLSYARHALNKYEAKGLLSPTERFLEEPQLCNEPLVQAGVFNTAGELVGCTTSWVMSACRESRKRHTA